MSQITTILIEQSERTDSGFRAVDAGLRAVTERLDRLIAVTIEERTLGIERIADIERRLAKLEARSGD